MHCCSKRIAKRLGQISFYRNVSFLFLKKRKKKVKLLLETTIYASFFMASCKGWLKVTTGALKGLQRGEIQLQSVARFG